MNILDVMIVLEEIREIETGTNNLSEEDMKPSTEEDLLRPKQITPQSKVKD